jgi:exopolysaccharide biosynthesis WecB/TagA/CpsF family protein
MNLRATFSGMPQPPAYDILGTAVARIGWDEALALLRRLLAEKRFTKVGFLNAHNANVACGDATFAGALSRFLVLPDGVGVDIAARLLYGAAFPANLNGTDFIPAFLRSVDASLKVGLLGATRHNAEAAAAALARLAPQHRYEVVHDGYFTREQDQKIAGKIAALRPDILLVAMGVPRQELWIDRNVTGSHCTLPIAVGALLDFLSGSVPRAPRWMRRFRVEWLYRLALEPGRLWRRYVLGNPLFLVRVLRQKLLGGGRRP